MKMNQKSERGADCEGPLVCSLSKKAVALVPASSDVTRTRLVALVVIRG